MDPNKILPDHDMEQAMEALKSIAQSMSIYFHEPKKSGLSRKEALELTVAYQNLMLLRNNSQ